MFTPEKKPDDSAPRPPKKQTSWFGRTARKLVLGLGLASGLSSAQNQPPVKTTEQKSPEKKSAPITTPKESKEKILEEEIKDLPGGLTKKIYTDGTVEIFDSTGELLSREEGKPAETQRIMADSTEKTKSAENLVEPGDEPISLEKTTILNNVEIQEAIKKQLKYETFLKENNLKDSADSWFKFASQFTIRKNPEKAGFLLVEKKQPTVSKTETKKEEEKSNDKKAENLKKKIDEKIDQKKETKRATTGGQTYGTGVTYGSAGSNTTPYGSMGTHNTPYGSMGVHNTPYGSMGAGGPVLYEDVEGTVSKDIAEVFKKIDKDISVNREEKKILKGYAELILLTNHKKLSCRELLMVVDIYNLIREKISNGNQKVWETVSNMEAESFLKAKKVTDVAKEYQPIYKFVRKIAKESGMNSAGKGNYITLYRPPSVKHYLFKALSEIAGKGKKADFSFLE